MAIWKDSPKQTAVPEAREPARFDAPATPEPVAAPSAVTQRAVERSSKESLIAADLTIEGKIEGAGNVRLAGRFKGDVDVRGDVTIETGAKLNGGVRADKVIIAGELEGNIEAAAKVELQQGGVLIGDLKAGSLTVAAGSRMRGQVDFGWEEDKGGKAGRGNGNGNGTESGGSS